MRAEHLPENWGSILRGDADTPFMGNNALRLTQSEMDGVLAFLRMLKPGVYVKCSRCHKMKVGTAIHFIGNDVSCGECI